MHLLEKLKSRWSINSTGQVLTILIVFACTGFTAVFARDIVFNFLGVTEQDPFWFKTLIWLITILPLYQVFLLIYAALFGQFEFFWGFMKKSFGRFIPLRWAKNGSKG
ncbi:MAG: DUF6787 family protein [Balneolaceae bacterium]